ncbi:hypothetical protein F5Y08DRAFT_62071 [Xylaria arbuscula]|nr:hypothetical protein F5Y08DRAFT_62071 [Xylaria arbuscula]
MNGLGQIQKNTISRDSTADKNLQQSSSFAYLGAKLESYRHTSLKPHTGVYARFENKTQVPKLTPPKNEATKLAPPRGRVVLKDESKWRWNCCGCGFQNLSYTYEPSCSRCQHRRDTTCKVWSLGT